MALQNNKCRDYEGVDSIHDLENCANETVKLCVRREKKKHNYIYTAVCDTMLKTVFRFIISVTGCCAMSYVLYNIYKINKFISYSLFFRFKSFTFEFIILLSR